MYSKIKTIWLKLFHTHYYKFQFKMGCNNYHQCRCGKRIVKSEAGGYSPVNTMWLEGLE